MNAVSANNVSATSEASIVVMPKIKAGLLKAIATTYTKRISIYPSIPTTAEQGYPTVQIGHWAGLYAPRGTPEAVIERMNAALQAALKTDEVKDKLIKTGIEPAGGSVADFVAFTKTERQRLSELAAKIKVDQGEVNDASAVRQGFGDLLGARKLVGAEHQIDDGVGFGLADRVRGEVLELAHDVGFAGEALLAAARRFDRLLERRRRFSASPRRAPCGGSSSRAR